MNLDDFQRYLDRLKKKDQDKAGKAVANIVGRVGLMLDAEAAILFPGPEDFQARHIFKMSTLGVLIETCIKEADEDMQEELMIIFTETLKEEFGGTSIPPPETD